MSSIDLRRFVNIDIVRHETTISSGSRDTVLLFTAEETDGNQHVISSMSEAESVYAGKPSTLAYLQMYFRNGGIKVKVVENTIIQNVTNELIDSFDNEYILIAYAAEASQKENVYSSLKTLAQARSVLSTVYGINEKIILASTSSFEDNTSVKNFAVKCSAVPGAEMTIAAYLSKINVYGVDTIYDYAFTQELISPEDISDEDYGRVIANNMNVDIELVGATRNCGGNCKDGTDIVNEFVRIILHQTLTDRLTSLLAQKIKSSSGLSKIYSVMTEELERYLTSGYLTTDKIWSYDTLSKIHNGQKYDIIEKGTPLTSGYLIKVLPMSALTEQEKQLRRTPPIYVIIAEQYGIRQITINGEVI